MRQRTASREAACRTLGEYLHGVEVSSGIRDILYRVNRPRPSSVMPNLNLNRLSMWGQEAEDEILIASDGTYKRTSSFFCRVELDMNNFPSNRLLDRDKVAGLFEELMSLGTEIANKGDIK